MAEQYDIGSHVGGPQIDISLFGDAASQGINAGNNLPTPTTAAIRGGLQGIQQGLQITGQYQQNQLRQNEINQLPVANAMRQEQLEAARMQNDIAALQNSVITNNQDVYLRQQKAKLEAEALQAEQAAQTLRAKDQLISDLNSNDPAAQKAILTKPEYQQILLSDPKLAEQVVGSLSQKGLLSEQEKTRAYEAVDFTRARELELKEREVANAARSKVLAQKDKIDEDFMNAPGFQQALQGIATPKEAYDSIQVYPSNVKSFDPTTNQLIKDAPDRPLVGDQAADDPLGRYDVVKNGVRITTVNREDAEKFFKGRRSQGVFDQSLRSTVYGDPQPGPRTANNTTQTAAGSTTPNPNGNIATAQAGGTPRVDLNRPNPGALVGNQAIVQSLQKDFQALANNAPDGIPPGTAEARLKETNRKIREGYAAARQEKAVQQRVGNLMKDLGQYQAQKDKQDALNDLFPPDAFNGGEGGEGFGGGGSGDMTSFVNPVKTPSAALTKALKAEATLRVEQEYPVASDIYNAVYSNPLLADQPALIKGLSAVESRGGLLKESPTGVKGLLQVTKATAADYGLNRDIEEENVKAGKLYLYDMLTMFENNLPIALAAYNAGQGTLKEAIREAGSTEWSKVKAVLKENLSEKKYAETSTYPDRVISAATHFLGKGGDTDTQFIYLLQSNGLISPKSNGR